MRTTIRFLLGRKLREVEGVSPTETVLGWLRRQERRTGTKEGCAEGDCGACTVVIGEVRDGVLRHRAVNACIQLLPTLDGKQLLTVEDLAAGDRLDPVQQAMIDRDASQCGFCTPGFVMSLHAHRLAGGGTDRAAIDEALAGNLCRCTGYGPIIEAARQALTTQSPGPDPDLLARLRSLEDGEDLVVEAKDQLLIAPASLDRLSALLQHHPEAVVLAGGTDVGLWVTKELRRLTPIVWIGRVAELQRIDVGEDGVEIGAGVTLGEAEPVLAAEFPGLAELLRRFASTQIRNAGTVCGNIANGSPIGDLPPALLALGATLVLRRGGETRTLDLDRYFLDYRKQDRRPGELLERVVIPRLPLATRLLAYKVSKRFDQDISAVCGCFALRIEHGRVADVRIAFGGMAAIPKRALAAEAALRGEPWSRASVEAAARALATDFSPIDDLRATRRYRLEVGGNLLIRAFLETTEPGEPQRVGALDPV